MPGGDRRGPLGEGPRTGRGLGDCNTANPTTNPPQYEYGYGRGRGLGRGAGRGLGRGSAGRGRGPGRGFRRQP